MILAPNPGQIASTGKKSTTSLIKLPLAEHMFTASNFFDSCECQSWIRFCNSTGFVEVKANATHGTARRYHGRIQTESISTADLIFRRLLPLLPTTLDGSYPVGCSSNIRLYRYTVGQSFGKHIDESKDDEGGLGVTKLTVLIYLSGDENIESRQRHLLTGADYLVGGETRFYSERITSNSRKSKQIVEVELCSVKPAAGKLLVHAHGDRCLTHEGAPVLQGVKYVLRTDVIYR
jgi:2OG-Fe(II) oxygenase superfamily